MRKENKRISVWVEKETIAADLGDKRLNRRLSNVLEMLSRKPTESIPASARGWSETKAAYRFFDNKDVTWEKVLKPHKEATLVRIKKEAVALLIQDTTDLDYSDKPETQGLGKLAYENQLGIRLHPTIAVTPERRCLGTVDAQILVREHLGKRKKKREVLPIEKKETIRWLNSYRVAQEVAQECANTQIVSISDREGDIYEIFVEAQQGEVEKRADWIIRGSQNRCLLEEEAGPDGNRKLLSEVSKAPIVANIEFDLPKTKNRKERRVKQEVRAISVCLKAPKNKGHLPDVVINAVYAKEIDAPLDVEAIEWLLLTSLPIDTGEKALRVIEWYLCRWQIEIFFKVLKSGCAVEELQLKTLDRLKPCMALYMIVAWRVLYIMMLGRRCPEMPCSAVFEEEEWQAVYVVVHRKPPPKKPPDMNSMVMMVASLGGFLCRKSDGFPGPKTVWIGLQRTKDFVIAIEAQKASMKVNMKAKQKRCG